ncbi:serine/threonine-protein kinase [Candidatus Viridilinea mediisalina]|uniref:Protein kinase n=1 Tax=Candidatus Viridilinea mediisalina TaxID=2024553 RepID=A0A2A6RLI8_9CHLR|nr:serine/threonine-protein kinase [Candidatus Viridilinea mediisalina]PDW03803.1 protein kinase [Candidatus Viridilinea mediisalina]
MNPCPNCTNPVAEGIAFCPECGARITAPTLAILQNRYELTQKLGQGGMGAVFQASDRRLSTVRWAVKELTDALITDPQERQQASEAFRREAELLASLKHPNLPRVTDHFTEDGKSYLVMELVEGESLQSFIQREGLPRPLPEVFAWVEQLCEVLHYLHSQRPPIIFRDLKPSNIMLTPTGQLKLIDFGIARLFKPGQAADTQAFGTMGYSAPEQYGRGQTDQRSDIYSLAVVIHQLLTGYDPSNTPFRIPAAAQLNPAVPTALSEVLERAMHNDRAQRFADIPALREALRTSGNLNPNPSVEIPTPAASPAPAPEGGISTSRIAFWMGVISMGWMVLAMAMVLLGELSGGDDSALAGFGLLLGMPPLILGPTAAVFAMISLFKPQSTPQSKQNAAVGIAAGVFTTFLCCATMMMIV